MSPRNPPRLEILGLDIWHDFEGLTATYSNPAEMAALGPAFSGRPAASVWEQAPGQWSEW